LPRRTVHLRITGWVQGVWYRGWAVETATALGLDGWVRNRRDGSVEAVAAGEAAAIEELIAACRQGPPAARVDRVDVTESGEQPGPGFRQVASA
jgi:acylphosphatase